MRALLRHSRRHRVCLLLQYLLQSCSHGGRGIVEEDRCVFMLLFVTAVPHVCVVFTALLPMCVVFLLTTYSSVTKQFACVWCVCTLYFVVFIPSNVGIRKAQRRLHGDARLRVLLLQPARTSK
jgi:hypothetical protein